jgi:hypothetical protein
MKNEITYNKWGSTNTLEASYCLNCGFVFHSKLAMSLEGQPVWTVACARQKRQQRTGKQGPNHNPLDAYKDLQFYPPFKIYALRLLKKQ